MALKSKILPGGVTRYIHVFVPVLQGRLQGGWKPNQGEQVWAVRSGLYRFTKMQLYRRVEILGPSEGVELDEPLPGTGGRGVAVVKTEHALRVWYEAGVGIKTITVKDDRASTEQPF